MKRNVEVFTVKKQYLSTYNYDYVSYYVMPNAVPFTCDQFFNAKEMEIKDVQLPIVKFYNKEPNGEVIERLCAFDHDLMSLIGCMQEQKDREICKAVSKVRKETDKLIKDREKELAFYKEMSFIERVVWAIRGEKK